MLAFLAILANFAITVVSAQGHELTDRTNHLFDKRLISGCRTSGPVSCQAGRLHTPSNLCCYESPGVRGGKI